jgi:molybdate-binding protein
MPPGPRLSHLSGGNKFENFKEDFMEITEEKLELVATKSFAEYEEMYKVIDFLNKNLKEKRVMLGLKKDKEKKRLYINIYEF